MNNIIVPILAVFLMFGTFFYHDFTNSDGGLGLDFIVMSLSFLFLILIIFYHHFKSITHELKIIKKHSDFIKNLEKSSSNIVYHSENFEVFNKLPEKSRYEFLRKMEKELLELKSKGVS